MRGCVIVHGLTGTPACIMSLKNSISSAGFSVATPCLAGHGGTLQDLANSTWQDWYDTIRISYTELKRSCDKVYYVGISLGALLGLKLAIDEGFGVRALALLSTPLELSNLEKAAVFLVQNTPLKKIVKSVKKNLVKSVTDPEGRALYEASSLPRIPSESVFELCKLQKLILKNIKSIKNPIFMVHSKHDYVATMKNVELVKRGVSSDLIETFILNKSRHVITMDIEKENVSQKVVEFFNKNA